MPYIIAAVAGDVCERVGEIEQASPRADSSISADRVVLTRIPRVAPRNANTSHGTGSSPNVRTLEPERDWTVVALARQATWEQAECRDEGHAHAHGRT